MLFEFLKYGRRIRRDDNTGALECGNVYHDSCDLWEDAGVRAKSRRSESRSISKRRSPFWFSGGKQNYKKKRRH
ncbi:hypothetical protein H6P81_016746 [Aristolochia fimbriata]|uniref:Uncharacterized protein n=1 Tax=Aristolochia fimbriata TaxID=158543 RepID=A0AAV7EC39_ARIFI|nr:hypothetical protein H6P81_016746 [Aristolochia fimbriata]